MLSYLVTAGEPSWVSVVGEALREVQRALPWVLGEHDRWRREHPVPRNAAPVACGRLERIWLLERPLAAAREHLESAGFQLSDGITRPFVDDPGTGGPPAHQVDAWHPHERVAVDIEWDAEDWPRPAPMASSLLKADVRYLVLARRQRGFAETERFLTTLFEDPVTLATIAAKLPLRGVFLASVA